MRPVKSWIRALGAACLCVAFATAGHAQSYPSRPVRLVIPYDPGGVVDYVGRALGQALHESLGQPVVTENHPGAGGIVGTDAVVHAAPDGYTLVIMDPAIVINPTLQSVPYDLFTQLETVSVVSSSPEVLVVAPDLPVKDFDQFVAYGKANPGKLNFASAGTGTTPHLAGEMFKQRTGIEATHVPYKGIAASFTDMLTGRVQFAFSSIAGALPFTSANRVRALATTGLQRSSIFPDLPTVDEAGLKGFTVDLWLAVFVPAGVPADVRTKLNAVINTALTSQDLKAALAKVGVEPRGTTAAAGAAFVRADYEKWKTVITEGKIKVN